MILPNGTTTGVNDAAGNPFWFNGLPSLGLNPLLFARQGPGTYNGSTRIDSGLPLGPPKPLNIKFSKPGVYKYFCDVHPGMVGTSSSSPRARRSPRRSRQTALAKQITGDVKVARKLAKSEAGRRTRSASASRPNDGVELYAMFPRHAEGQAEHAVTFTMSKDTRETHTATFGPASVLKTLSDGFQGANFPSQGVYPSDPAAIVVSPDVAWRRVRQHGRAGYGTPARRRSRPSNKIDFTTPGTYHFQCLIHPFMQGTIVVQ